MDYTVLKLVYYLKMITFADILTVNYHQKQ